MAKITLADGSVFEGTISEWVALSKVVEAEAPTQDAPLKVGDYVKIVDASGRNSGVVEGQIRVITKVDDSDMPYAAETLDGSAYDWFRAYRIVKATDAEVAAAQASVAEAERWDEIGRKVNEFKAGDIVRYLGGASTNGQLREVSQVPQVGFVNLVAGPYGVTTERVSNVELLTPVEDRFDR